jgi:hypothetical protein
MIRFRKDLNMIHVTAKFIPHILQILRRKSESAFHLSCLTTLSGFDITERDHR